MTKRLIYVCDPCDHEGRQQELDTASGEGWMELCPNGVTRHVCPVCVNLVRDTEGDKGA